jgi:hypothetical protein
VLFRSEQYEGDQCRRALVGPAAQHIGRLRHQRRPDGEGENERRSKREDGALSPETPAPTPQRSRPPHHPVCRFGSGTRRILYFFGSIPMIGVAIGERHHLDPPANSLSVRVNAASVNFPLAASPTAVDFADDRPLAPAMIADRKRSPGGSKECGYASDIGH